MSNKLYIIGDVHGCSQTLRGLISTFDELVADDKIIFIGDLIDRGPDSMSVLDQILELKDKGIEVIIIRGNHEQMMLDSINNSKSMKLWFRNGGLATLDSFGVYHPGFIEDKYLEIIYNSKYYYETEKFVIVHAGMNFNIENPFNDKAKMLAVRIESCDIEKIGNRRLIVGHTPYPLDSIKSSLSSDLIRLDGGCVYHRKVNGLGYLVALELNSFELFHYQNAENIDSLI
ncbi:MAG: serine/threonine protein phosphatase [Candidatus Kapabacteria bacterium]|nr:serine/threonine protein phosphatase [Ignavibacteriota bacterium]MCW5884600.1 serine/threonine protein phosphatase [Candidatus Kapabacteria bacterium]